MIKSIKSLATRESRGNLIDKSQAEEISLIARSSYQLPGMANLNVKMVSSPFDSAVSVPPCCSAIFAPIAKPSPFPGYAAAFGER